MNVPFDPWYDKTMKTLPAETACCLPDHASAVEALAEQLPSDGTLHVEVRRGEDARPLAAVLARFTRRGGTVRLYPAGPFH